MQYEQGLTEVLISHIIKYFKENTVETQQQPLFVLKKNAVYIRRNLQKLKLLYNSNQIQFPWLLPFNTEFNSWLDNLIFGY